MTKKKKIFEITELQKQTMLKMVNGILLEFDFDKVHSYMDHVNWEWKNEEGFREVPSVSELMFTCKNQLIKSYLLLLETKERQRTSSGGFIYEMTSYKGQISMDLTFRIECANYNQSETDLCDDEYLEDVKVV